ncbi:MAG: cation diffusion facilitator family transporter [Anaeroplasmataceae bacterium]
MITILRKLFIKNYNDLNDKTVKENHGKLASIIGIIFNLILFVVKIIIGVLSNSISIIADAINNIGDFASSIICLIGFKISSSPPDKEHPFGHKRIEHITSLVVSIIIIVVGAQLFISSIDKIINKQQISISIYTMIILLSSIFVKIILFIFNRKMSKLTGYMSLKATAQDSINDVIVTTFVLVSAMIFYFSGKNLDGYFGLIISLFIIISGIKLVKQSSSPLISEPTDSKLIDDIVTKIKSFDNIYGVHDIICHSYGDTNCFVSLHVEVDGSQTVLAIHERVDEIENIIKNQFDVDLVIHIDPIDLSDEDAVSLKKYFYQLVKDYNVCLELHDFRIIKATNAITTIFEISHPIDIKINHNELITYIESNSKEKGNFIFKIKIEHVLS